MSIYPQPNTYECGPFALKHALLTLGIFGDERRIARVAGTSHGGTDEAQLARAARRFGCELPVVRRLDAAAACSELIRRLAVGQPTLLCVDDWEHWVTAVGVEGSEFVLMDSAAPGVVRVVDWRVLRERWVYREWHAPGRSLPVYDLHPVVSRRRLTWHARLTPEPARLLARAEYAGLVRDWSTYARDLLAVCEAWPPENGDLFAVSLEDLLGNHRRELLDQLDGTDESKRRVIARTLRQLRFLAHTYDLRVTLDRRNRVVAEVKDMLRRLVR